MVEPVTSYEVLVQEVHLQPRLPREVLRRAPL